MACEVSRIAYLVGKDKPSSGYSTLHGFPPQVIRRGGALLDEPQHAAVDRAKKTHPYRENLGCNFVSSIERAENKTLLRQTTFVPRRCAVGDTPLRVIRLIAVGQIHHFFRIPLP